MDRLYVLVVKRYCLQSCAEEVLSTPTIEIDQDLDIYYDFVGDFCVLHDLEQLPQPVCNESRIVRLIPKEGNPNRGKIAYEVILAPVRLQGATPQTLLDGLRQFSVRG